MKIKSSRLFTHPVLAEEHDDYKTCTFSAKRFFVDAADNLVLDMNFSTNCTEIKQLIRSGKAKYLLHVECPTTLYRKIFGNISDNFSVLIPLNDLKGRPDCVAFIVTSENVNFSCNDFNNDFSGIIFDLPKGSVLAYENLFPLIINEDPNVFKNAASIFTISKRMNDISKPFEVNLQDEKINVALNETDYNLYGKYRNSRNLQPILNAMIILPTLVFVFEELKADMEDFSTYGGYEWFLSLKTNFAKRGITNFAEYIEEKTSIELAQEVMQSPLTKGLKNIALVYEDATGSEEDS